MNPERLRDIVEAVLYEGYVLYPYRPSSKKNRRERFTFGRVYPKDYSQAQDGREPCGIRTECLVRLTKELPVINVAIGFLQPMAREIAALETPVEIWTPGWTQDLAIIPELRVGDKLFQTWQEAVERKVTVPVLTLKGDSPVRVEVPFHFSEARQFEPIRDEDNAIIGMILRRQEVIEGDVELSVEALGPTLRKISVQIWNRTPLATDQIEKADSVLMRTFASTHITLNAEGADFVSLLDPPTDLKEFAGGCKNLGVFPVLVGDEGLQELDTMLASPIILYDYPKIAPESAGPLFDGTEIDEILTLRLLTMTDEEKREMCGVDEHARRLLERTETLPNESLLKLHGTMRPTPPTPIEFDDFFGARPPLRQISVQGVFLQAGDRVRLRPKARADVLDLALNGQIAVIEAIEQDLEQRIHVAVVLESDPGKDLGLLRQPGHRFFYGIDEVEPLKQEVS